MFRIDSDMGVIYINTHHIAMMFQQGSSGQFEITLSDGSILYCADDVGMEIIATFGEIKGRI